MSSEIIRRRAMYQAKIDEYEGVDFGAAIGGGKLVTYPLAVTDFIAIPPNCTALHFRHYTDFGVSSGLYAFYYDGQKVYKSGQVYNNPDSVKVSTFSAGAYAFTRMCLNLDRIDDCYIYDATNRQYLWKGKNVT